MTVPSPTVIVGGALVSTVAIAFSLRCAAYSELADHERAGMRLACVTTAGARIGVSPSPLPGPAAKVPSRGCLRHGATAAWLIEPERRVPSAAPSDRREGLVQSPSTPLAPTAPARRERRRLFR